MRNNEGRRGIMVAELEHHARLLLRRAAKLQADLDVHIKAADLLERNMERFSVADIVAFTEARQRAAQLSDSLRHLQNHWRVSAAVVEHDILGTWIQEIENGTPNQNNNEDPGKSTS